MAIAFATGKLEVRACESCGREIQHREMGIGLHPPITKLWHATPHGCKGVSKVVKELPIL